jgi:hypothetical protein
MKPCDIEGYRYGDEATNASLEPVAASIEAVCGVGGRTVKVQRTYLTEAEFEDIIRNIAG